MPLEFRCPGCGSAVTSFMRIGETATCRSCGTEVQVPETATPTEAEIRPVRGTGRAGRRPGPVAVEPSDRIVVPPPAPDARPTRLVVRRDRAFVDWTSRYRIELDGFEVGRLWRGGELELEILEGQHVLQARTAWCGCAPLRFEAGREPTEILVRSALLGWKGLIEWYYVFFEPMGYLEAELISGTAVRDRA